MGENRWVPAQREMTRFLEILDGHQKVVSFEKTSSSPVLIRIERVYGDKLHVLLTDIYTLGVVDVRRAFKEADDIDILVTMSSWNAYSLKAENLGKKNGIGVFNGTEFFGALWWSDNINDYVKKDNDGEPIKFYRSTS